MKTNKNLVFIIAALLGGLLLGYFLFHKNSDSHVHESTAEGTQAEVWTCSMHPQIRQSEPGSCPICGMDLIRAENGDGALEAGQFRMTENAMQLANIQTRRVGSGTEDGQQLTLSGTIQENEETNTVQVVYFSGRIERLQVNFTGETVRKGALLGRIYSPELVAAQQELITAVSLKESQPQLYNAVRNKLKLWKLSEQQIQNIEEAGTIQENFPVYATVGGIVKEKLVSEGDYVTQGQALFKITNLNTVWAVFDAYENQISSLKAGQEIEIRTNALPNQSLVSRITFIDPVLNSSTRTVRVRATLSNKNGIFKPGMFVEGKVSIGQNEIGDKIIIPASSILWTGERSVVYVKPKPGEPVFEMREVQLGKKIGQQYELINGLSSGEEIVVNGTFTIDAAAQLQGKKSMMNPMGDTSKTGHEGHTGDGMQGKSISANPPGETSAFREQIAALIGDYLNLTEALVQSKPKAAAGYARSFKENLSAVDMSDIKDEPGHSVWIKIRSGLENHIRQISEQSDLKKQRDHFKPLSALMIESLEQFGAKQTLYSVYCPMADNNTGGYWLSPRDEVINPYFGSAMLKCGSVKQKFN